MKRAFLFLLSLLVAMILIGCGKPAEKQSKPKPPAARTFAKGVAIEGRIFDSAKNPVKGLKVGISDNYSNAAELDDTTTNKEGRFRFTGLKAGAEYKCILKPKNWSVQRKNYKITAPKKRGETAVFDRDIVLFDAVDSDGSAVNPNTGQTRFRPSPRNTIVDSLTGLEWLTTNPLPIRRDEAEPTIARMGGDGGGWRFPTQNELMQIWLDAGRGQPHFDPIFNQKHSTSVWAEGRPADKPEQANMVMMKYNQKGHYAENKRCLLFAVRQYEE